MQTEQVTPGGQKSDSLLSKSGSCRVSGDADDLFMDVVTCAIGESRGCFAKRFWASNANIFWDK